MRSSEGSSDAYHLHVACSFPQVPVQRPSCCRGSITQRSAAQQRRRSSAAAKSMSLPDNTMPMQL